MERLADVVSRIVGLIEKHGASGEAAGIGVKILREYFGKYQPCTPGQGLKELRPAVEHVLYGIGCIGALTVSVTAAKGAKPREGVVPWPFANNLLYDVRLIPVEVRHVFDINQMQDALHAALLAQPTDMDLDVRDVRVRNILDAVRVIVVCALAGDSHKIWKAKPWLELTHVASLHGCIHHGTNNEWVVYA